MNPSNKLSPSIVYETIQSTFNIKIKTPITNYKNSTTKLELICPNCNTLFERSFNKLKTGVHKTCNSCAKKLAGENKKLNIEYCKNFAKKNNCKLLDDKYINSSTKMNFIGTCGHEYQTNWNSFTQEKKFQCSKCGNLKKGKHHRHTYETILNTCNKNNNKLLTTKEQWENLEHKYPILECPKCKNPFERINKYIIKSKTKLCAKCSGSLPTSSYEIEIIQWLSSLGIKTEQSNREHLNGQEIDIFIPSKNIGIEINGIYYHSELFKPDKYYHYKKTELANKKNINLLQFWDIEWLYKKEIVKSIILSKIGISQNTYDARKLEYKKILNKSLVKDFLNNNHLQGHINGDSYGLFNNNELISLIVIGKGRYDKSSTEILRFCNKLNSNVRGGFSRLLSNIIKELNLANLISYCDLRYSNGNSYLKNNFRLSEITEPNYYYFNNKKDRLYHRSLFQKHKLTNLNSYNIKKTEKEIMLDEGYNLVYDCGQLKFKYIN